MEDRFAALEQRLSSTIGEIQRLSTSEQSLIAEVTRLSHARPPPPPEPSFVPVPGSAASYGIDTRTLGKPDIFHGEDVKWADWRVIVKAYYSAVSTRMGVLMTAQEGAAQAMLQATLSDSVDQSASAQLYLVLLMLCRGQPLTEVVNAGESEGLAAWKRLCDIYEPHARSRVAGLLLTLLSYNFAGDVEARVAAFERDVQRYEQRSGEPMSDSMKIGVVLKQLDEGSLRQHLLMNAARLSTWLDFKREVQEIRRAQASIVATPMDIGAFQKGGKGDRGGKGKGGKDSDMKCSNCGRANHWKRDCRSPGGGAHDPSKGGKGKDGGKNPKGGKDKGKGGKGQGPTCWKCGGKGHISKDCQSKPRSVNAFEETPHGGPPDLGSLYIAGLEFDLNPLDMGYNGPIQDGQTMRVGIDSGAARSVMPSGWFDDYPVTPTAESRARATYRTATGAEVRDEGMKSVAGRPAGAAAGLRLAHFRVAGVSKPLMSVAEMVDANYSVIFERDDRGVDRSRSIDRETGEVLYFVRRNNVYEVDWAVMPYDELANEPKGDLNALGDVEVSQSSRLAPIPEPADVSTAITSEVEGPAARAARQPQEPTQDEVRQHEVSHEPYRAWCASCVAGRGLSREHRAADHEESAIAVAGFDYGFFSEGSSPLLCGKDSKHRWFYAAVVPSKGVIHPWPVKSFVHRLSLAGHRRMILRSDGEPSVVAWKTQVAAKLRLVHGIEILPQESGVDDSQGNGLAEHAVREIKAKTRTLRHQCETIHKVSLGEDHLLIPWIVEFAAMSINVGRRGADGRTAYELRYGRAFRRELAIFGEKVLYLPSGQEKVKLADKFHEGLYIGITQRTDESLIATKLGIVRCRTFKRLPEGQRGDRELLAAVVGTPWTPVPSQAGDDEIPVVIRVNAAAVVRPEELPPPIVPRGPELLGRRVYLRGRKELARYGHTDGCPGCVAAFLDASPAEHTAECRERITAAMRADPMDAVRIEESERRAATANANLGRRKLRRVDTGDDDDLNIQPGGAATSSSGAVQAPSASSSSAVALPAAGAVVVLAHDVPVPVDMDLEQEAMELHMLLMSLGMGGQSAVDVMEVFCPGRPKPYVSMFGLVHGGAFDLRDGWNLSDPEHVVKALEEIRRLQPLLILGSPKSAAPGAMQRLRPGTTEHDSALNDRLRHLQLVMKIYKDQVTAGRLFLHEHPWPTSSWTLDCVLEVRRLVGVTVAYGDQCPFGLVVPDEQGDSLAQKPTGWMSNCKEILAEVACVCPNDTKKPGEAHRHSTMTGRDMRKAERYPPRLLKAILRGLRRHIDGRPDYTIGALDAGPHVDEEEPSLKDFSGKWIDSDRMEFYDELTGLEMEPDMVRAARRTEMEFMATLNVWSYSTVAQAHADIGRAPFGVRWIDSDKGDSTRPDYRSRLVVQETRASSTIAPGDVYV